MKYESPKFEPLGLTLFYTDAKSRGYDMNIYKTFYLGWSGGGQPAGRYWPINIPWKPQEGTLTCAKERNMERHNI